MTALADQTILITGAAKGIGAGVARCCAGAGGRVGILDADGDGGPTTVTLEQDGNDSQEQADQFSQSWQGMLESLKSTVESG